ncbi:hypothetical protein D3C84_789050 [compost metagenome]
MNKIVENVESLINEFGDKVNTDKKLVLLYWQRIDEIKMDKDNISTSDWLLRSTPANQIIDAKCLLDLRNAMKE